MTLAYVLWGVDLILLIIVLCTCNQIKVAVKIIELTADFVSDVPRVIFVPLIMTAIMLVGMIAWAYSFAFLASAGTELPPTDFIVGTMEYSVLNKILLA